MKLHLFRLLANLMIPEFENSFVFPNFSLQDPTLIIMTHRIDNYSSIGSKVLAFVKPKLINIYNSFSSFSFRAESSRGMVAAGRPLGLRIHHHHSHLFLLCSRHHG